MLKHLFTALSCLWLAASASAQKVETISGTLNLSTPARGSQMLACDNQAGTFTLGAFDGKSNDVSLDTIFLCKSDSLSVIHNGNAVFTSDPNPLTASGVGYFFYKCKPTVAGLDSAMVGADPCILSQSPGKLYIAAAPVVPAGNTQKFDIRLVNDGAIQTLFGAPPGKPTLLWFAPTTLDNFALRGFESANGLPPFGTCINVNTSAAFAVVYLNELDATNKTTAGLTGSFNIAGGLPERNGSNYTILIERVFPAGVAFGAVTSGVATQNSTVQYTVPTAGTYKITVSDGKACPVTFQHTFSNLPVTFTAANAAGLKGSNVCVDIKVQNFNQIQAGQFTITWDTTVMNFSSIQNINTAAFGASLSLSNFGTVFNIVNPGRLTFSYSIPSDSLNCVTAADGTTMFQVCFTIDNDANTNPGDVSPVVFSSALTPIDFIYCGTNQAPFTSVSGSVTVTSSTSLIQLALVPMSATCPTLTDGKISITAIGGGTPPYSFTWQKIPSGTPNGSNTIASNGATTAITGLTPGKYRIATQDVTGAATLRIDTVEVLQPPVLGASIKDTLPTCNGLSNGKMCAQISVNGVTLVNPGAQYQFVWSANANNATTYCISGLGFGNYSFTVTDVVSGCTAIAATTLGQPAVLDVTINKTDVSCTPNNGGTASSVPTGGTTPYNYLWTTGSVAPNIINLLAGTYKVVVTDINGCKDSATTNILPPSAPKIDSFRIFNALCNGANDGAITVFATQGGSPITNYQWSNAQSGITKTNITNLLAATYFITVTGQDGCATIDSAKVTQPTAIVIDDIKISKPKCTGDSNGSITMFVSGGTSPYKYFWTTAPNDPLSGGLKNQLAAGSYGVTIQDAKGCQLVRNAILVNNPPPLLVTYANIKSTKCYDSTPCEGGATAAASGGTGSLYNYTWQQSGEQNLNVVTSTAVQLCRGWQKLIVTDSNNCKKIDSVLIGSPAPLLIDLGNINSKDISCKGLSDGSTTVSGVGGVSPYTYVWDNSAATVGPTLNNVVAGVYNVTVKDANNCVKTLPITVKEPAAVFTVSIDLAGTRNVTCSNKTDGEIALLINGGNLGAYNFNWTNNVSTTPNAVNLLPGFYAVTVTDIKGCSDTAGYFVRSPPPISAVVPTPEQPKCFGEQTTLTVDMASGGNGPIFKFSVDDGILNPVQPSSVIPIFAGQHIVKVYDGLGCEYVDTIDVTEPPQVIVSLGPDVKVELGGEVELRGAVQSVYPLDSTYWTPTTSLRLNSVGGNPLQAFASPPNNTVYTLLVIDINGCVGSDDIGVEVDRNRNVYIPNVFSPNGDGTNDFFGVFAGLGVSDVNFIQVFDRWGSLVYSTESYTPTNAVNKSNGWDGTFNGKPLDVGVYVYVISVGFIDKIKPIVYRGDVTIVK